MNPSVDKGGYRATVDFTLDRPQKISIANCVSARTNRGISNRYKKGSGIYEVLISQKL